jgi:exopolysaccharide biosynthesis polyprenyl glycosylphosphotransferase
VQDEGTAKYRAAGVPPSARIAAATVAVGDLVALAAITWAFSSLKNGFQHLDFLIGWHPLVVAAVVLSSGYVAGLYVFDRVVSVRWLGLRVLGTAATSAIVLGLVVYLTAGWEDNLGPLGRIVMSESLAAYSLWAFGSRALALRWIEARAEQAQWLVLSSPGGPSQAALARLSALPGFGRTTVLAPPGASSEGAAGTWDELERFLERPWAGVVLAQDAPLPDAASDALMRARLGGAMISDLTDLSERLSGRVPLERVRSQWFALSDGFDIVHSRTGLRIKRLVDLLVSFVMLVLASPLMLLAALLVGASSRGPVLFSQVRVGRRGRPFTMWKFRTMRRDAEAAGAQWAKTSDPRVTPVGRLLRATRVDELPQLWNILRGDMSFIGPRPERPEFTATLEREIPFYRLRHLVKPGLTGWAQVCYPYGASVAEAREKLEYDLYYIKNHSLPLDALILLRTVRVVIHRHGAR